MSHSHDDRRPLGARKVLTGSEQAVPKEFVDAGMIEMLQRRAERYWIAVARATPGGLQAFFEKRPPRVKAT